MKLDHDLVVWMVPKALGWVSCGGTGVHGERAYHMLRFMLSLSWQLCVSVQYGYQVKSHALARYWYHSGANCTACTLRLLALQLQMVD